MMKLYVIAVLSLAALLAIACASPAESISIAKAPASPAPNQQSAVNEPDDKAPRISLADAKAAFDANNAIFVDVRAADAYKQEHIKGAINIPKGTLDAHVDKLSKAKKIIAYCS